MKIPLFDLDWTLIKGGNKTHLKSFEISIKKVLNIQTSLKNRDIQGKIDSQILLELAASKNINIFKTKRYLPLLIKEMEEYFLRNAKTTDCIAMSGAFELLKTLKDKKFLIGILTGNIKIVGEYKLLHAGLKNFINFGVFGDMAIKRVDLVPLVLKEARKFNKKILKSDLVIIGDSVRDIECARESGIEIIAVATGKFRKEELIRKKPDLLVNNLLERDKIINFLMNQIHDKNYFNQRRYYQTKS